MKAVIIEGPDRCGKNTLISNIIGNLKNAYVYHCGKPSGSTPEEQALNADIEYERMCLKVKELKETDVVDTVIFNRFCYGEYVYGQKYRHRNPEEVLNMIECCEKTLYEICDEGVYVICMTCQDPMVLVRNEDGDSQSEGDYDAVCDELMMFKKAVKHTGDAYAKKIFVNIDEDGKFRNPIDIYHDAVQKKSA